MEQAYHSKLTFIFVTESFNKNINLNLHFWATADIDFNHFCEITKNCMYDSQQ